MKEFHIVRNVSFEGETLNIEVDGMPYTFPLVSISTRLASASKQEREVFEVSPSGYGIHWPIIDEDLSIDGLLGVVHSPKRIGEKVTE